MKKTLIALAAVAATGAAFAQSSVTVYGVADVSVGDDNVAGSKFRAYANETMNNGSSRIGFRGVEDLGGGLKAGFNFEQGVNAATGGTDANTFQRAANMSLMGGFGEIRLGRSLTTSFYSVAAWELTGTANYSAVAKQFSFAGAGSRENAQIMYNSPSFGGLKFSAATILKGNDALVAAARKVAATPTAAELAAEANAAGQQSKVDMSVTYGAGPLTASVAYNKLSGSGNAAVNKANYAIGAKYDLGVMAVAGSFQKIGMSGKKGFTVGVSAPMGPVTLTADIARATDTANKNTDFLLEAKYALSKRTFLYGVFLRDGGTPGKDSINNYNVGVRHNF